MDVWSDTHDQERTHPRNNESDSGFQKDHAGEMVEWYGNGTACDEETNTRQKLLGKEA